ncbi:hypothetical protein Hanom_Chr06g00531661 [Helianthus anomalus]
MPILDDFSGDDDVDVVRLKRKVVVLEQDSVMKDVKIVNLEGKKEVKDIRIEQLEGEVIMLINLMYDLKVTLRRSFGEEFANKGDRERYESITKITPEKRAHVDAEREAALQQYLDTPHDKKKELLHGRRRRRRRKR